MKKLKRLPRVQPTHERWLFAADTHLDLGAWPRRPGITGDSLYGLEQIVGIALNRKVDAVCIAGDVFDTKTPPTPVIDEARRLLDDLKAYNIRVYYIQGQHDMVREGHVPWLSAIHDWPVCLNNRTVILQKFVICGLDFHPREKLADAVEAMSAVVQKTIVASPGKKSLLVCHQVWEEFMGSITLPEGSLSDLPFDVVVTGDLHDSKILEVSGDDGTVRTVISPGATHLRKASEPAKHRVVEIALDPDCEKMTRWHVLKSRQKYIITIGTEPPEQALAKVREVLDGIIASTDVDLPVQIRTPIVVIQYDKSKAGIFADLRSWAEGKVHLFEKLTSADGSELIEVEYSSAPQVGTAALLENLGKLLTPDSSEFNGLHRLLTSIEPKRELAQMRSEHFAAEASTH